jgi:hypothetical protein
MSNDRGDNYASTIPHYEMASHERGSDAEGQYGIINATRAMAAVVSAENGVMGVPLLGGTFFFAELPCDRLRKGWIRSGNGNFGKYGRRSEASCLPDKKLNRFESKPSEPNRHSVSSSHGPGSGSNYSPNILLLDVAKECNRPSHGLRCKVTWYAVVQNPPDHSGAGSERNRPISRASEMNSERPSSSRPQELGTRFG